jgi:pimeloyl-ACP methyl ester carboxylesterase
MTSAPTPQRQTDRAEAGLAGFVSRTANVNGIKLHYVRGGEGPAVVLIHGFPQSWYEYHAVMPRLAQRYTVIAIDLRGIGGSSASEGGFDAANMAQDVHELAATLNLGPVYLVGHDIGAMVAYAFARRFPDDAHGVMLLDAPIPGIAGWREAQSGPSVWHVGFMQVPGLAEKLVAGRQSDFFGYFFTFGKIMPNEAAQYVRAYGGLPQLHAVFEIFRAFPQNVQFNETHTGPDPVPVVIATGDKSPFARIVPDMAADLRAKGFSEVETAQISGSVHYVVDDQPEAIASLIEHHASRRQSMGIPPQ